MTSTEATCASWARIEITRVNRRSDGDYKFRVCVEGNEALREYLRTTVQIGKTSFFLSHMPLRDAQHRMDGYLTQKGGRVFFPVYKLFELMEQKGYRMVGNTLSEALEIYLWRKNMA